MSILRNFFTKFNFLLLILTPFLALQAEEPAGSLVAPSVAPSSVATDVFLILPEPHFLRPPVSFPIAGSNQVVQTIGRFTKGDCELLTKEQFAQLEKEMPDWKKQAILQANEFVKKTPIRWIRDDHEVILAAVLESDSMETCAALFSPELLRRYEDVFGPEFYVAVPSRFRIYLFPKLASRIQEFAPMVLPDYRASAHPVSQEVFEIGRKGVKVVGILDDR